MYALPSRPLATRIPLLSCETTDFPFEQIFYICCVPTFNPATNVFSITISGITMSDMQQEIYGFWRAHKYAFVYREISSRIAVSKYQRHLIPTTSLSWKASERSQLILRMVPFSTDYYIVGRLVGDPEQSRSAEATFTPIWRVIPTSP